MLSIFCIAAVFGLACSGIEDNKKINQEEISGEMMLGLRKTASNYKIINRNTVLINSADKDKYPIPENCKRELEFKENRDQSNCNVSTVMRFWPDSATQPIEPGFGFGSYALECQGFVYCSIVQDTISTGIHCQLGLDVPSNEIVFVHDTVSNENTDYQFVSVRHTKQIPWYGRFWFSHSGKYKYTDSHGNLQSKKWTRDQVAVSQAFYREWPIW